MTYPGLLQTALDYIAVKKTGRTDVWLVSDLRQSDWDAAGGRWAALRSGFGALQGVRFQVLAYPETSAADLGISVEKVTRRETADKAELLLDLRLTRGAEPAEPIPVPLRVVVNGVSSNLTVGTERPADAAAGPGHSHRQIHEARLGPRGTECGHDAFGQCLSLCLR